MTERWSEAEREKFRQQAEVQRDQLWQSLRKAGLWPHMSPREQELAHSTMVTMTDQQQKDATWRLEAAQTLMWALGVIPELPAYDTMANEDLLKQIPSDDLP